MPYGCAPKKLGKPWIASSTSKRNLRDCPVVNWHRMKPWRNRSSVSIIDILGNYGVAPAF